MPNTSNTLEQFPSEFEVSIHHISDEEFNAIVEGSDATTREMISASIRRHLANPKELLDLISQVGSKFFMVSKKIFSLFSPIDHKVYYDMQVKREPLSEQHVIWKIEAEGKHIMSAFIFEGDLFPKYNPEPFVNGGSSYDESLELFKLLNKASMAVSIPGCTHGKIHQGNVAPHMGIVYEGEVVSPLVNDSTNYDGFPVPVETDLVGGGIVWIDGECTFCDREVFLSAAEEHYRQKNVTMLQANWFFSFQNYMETAMKPSRAFVPLEYNGIVQIKAPNEKVYYLIVNSLDEVSGYTYIHTVAKLAGMLGSEWKFAGFDYIGGGASIATKDTDDTVGIHNLGTGMTYTNKSAKPKRIVLPHRFSWMVGVSR